MTTLSSTPRLFFPSGMAGSESRLSLVYSLRGLTWTRGARTGIVFPTCLQLIKLNHNDFRHEDEQDESRHSKNSMFVKRYARYIFVGSSM